MQAVLPLLAILAVAVMAIIVLASLRVARVRRSNAQRIGRAGEGRNRISPAVGVAISPSVRLLSGDGRPGARNGDQLRSGTRPVDADLNEVLQGRLAADTFNRAIRILAWSFIVVVTAGVWVSQLWQSVSPDKFMTLVLSGASVLLVYEIAPPGRFRDIRILLEASGALVFATMLVLLTGGASSPFFFLYPLIVGGVALIASPILVLVIALGTAVASGFAAFSGSLAGDAVRDAALRYAVNVITMGVLGYAGLVIAGVQLQTRETAIRLSTVDSLTDLNNRPFLFNSIDREIRRSRRFRRGFCLLMMDLDGLKTINDRYGHNQGDLVIRGVAHVIRTSLRGVDVAARIGGDEYVALLPETQPSGGYVIAEKIRQAASEMVVATGGEQIVTSLSIGVVSFPDDGQTADELMIAADQAMYASKRLGKNKVVGYADFGSPGVPVLAEPYRTSVSTPGFRLFARNTRSQPELGDLVGWARGDPDREALEEERRRQSDQEPDDPGDPGGFDRERTDGGRGERGRV